MRFGVVLSAAIHVGVIAAGLIVPVSTMADPVPQIYIPIELVDISDTTNIAPVTEEAKVEDKPAEEEVKENVLTASTAKAPEDIVALPEAETPPPPKKEPDVKKDVKPAEPKQTREQEINSTLDGILAGVQKKPPAPSRSATNDKAANTQTGAPRMGVGDMKRMTATVTEYIRAQLIRNQCWTDHSDMADARRLRTTIRVWFGRDGRFSRDPQLIEPAREPSGDPPMQVFVSYARTALNKCNTIGWIVPPEYFKLEPAPYFIDLVFLPKVGAQ